VANRGQSLSPQGRKGAGVMSYFYEIWQPTCYEYRVKAAPVCPEDSKPTKPKRKAGGTGKRPGALPGNGGNTLENSVGQA